GLPAVYRDPADGRWFDSPAMGPADAAAVPQILRPRDLTDGPNPSGIATAAAAFLTAAALTGDDQWWTTADELLAEGSGLALHAPRAAGWDRAVASARALGPLPIAVTGPDTAARSALATSAWRDAPAGSVIDTGPADAPRRALLADRTTPGGGAAAHI